MIWAVLGSIAFSSQLAEGASQSLWLVAADTLGVVAVFVLSIKYGVGGLTRRDIIALIIAAVGLVLWYFTQHAFVALFITIGVDATGTVLSVLKSYEDPGSETLVTWIMVGIAGILAMLSVGSFDVVLLSWPLYITLANFSVAAAILLGRSRTVPKQST